MDDVILLLQELIRIPSVNPDNSPGTDRVGEALLAHYLKTKLEELGANVTLEEVQPNRPNLIARFAPVDGRPRMLLGPHLDTVGVCGMTIDPFAAECREGSIFGRGACDTKGPMAAMLWALAQHHQSLAAAPIAVDFVAFMGEESGQWGSKHFAQHHGHLYQFAVVGEPTSMDVVHVTKGSLWATLQAKGRAAHSSMPSKGENAVIKLCQALVHLVSDLEPKLQTYTHPTLGHATLNVGVMRGGSRPNIVPDLAEAEIDIRVTPTLAASGGAKRLLESSICRLNLPITVSRCHENPPMETDPHHPMIQQFLRALPSTSLVGAPWFSDAAHLANAGIPSVCIGPGSIHQAHTAAESIEISALIEGAERFSTWLGTLLKITA